MKLKDLARHLEKTGCLLRREGSGHSIYKNSSTGMMTAVPRHREIKESLVRKICDDLGIERPKRK